MSEVQSGSNSDGFIHDKGSHRVTLLNNSTLFTLNSIPQNIVGKRAALLLIDESAHTDEDLINAVLPFIAQKSDFKLSTEEDFNQNTLRKQVPTQVIFSSSASESTHIHAQKYKDFAMKMIAGDSNYYVADIPCDLPLHPFVDGKEAPPLLEQSEIDDMMSQNPQKALREFYNKFTADGGDEQLVRWKTIKDSEKFVLPQLFANDKSELFAISYDSALQSDNSIIMVMKLIHCEERGWYGQIINVINLYDNTKSGNIQLKSQDQLKRFREVILDYNICNKDYDNIEAIAVDAGHAAMLVFLDLLLADWVDDEGINHKGFIDVEHPRYENEEKNYTNAWSRMQAVSPQKYRSEMCGDIANLLKEGLIEFPHEYDGRGRVAIENKDGSFTTRELSQEERLSLVNIDLLKTEVTSIHKTGTRDNPKYGLPKNKSRKMYDDRFYALALLGRILTQLRREDELGKTRNKKDFNWADYILY